MPGKRGRLLQKLYRLLQSTSDSAVLQNIYNNRLETVKISDIIRPGKDEYFGRFYVVIKVNLREKNYECIYSNNHDVYEQVKTAESYDDFIKNMQKNIFVKQTG